VTPSRPIRAIARRLALLAALVAALSATQPASAELPLHPERTVAFETDEGTWMSLDVSPDGETLVFDLLGDLYLLGIGGGEARAITHGLAFDTQPVFSPDGR
jgi:hypothetical protein